MKVTSVRVPAYGKMAGHPPKIRAGGVPCPDDVDFGKPRYLGDAMNPPLVRTQIGAPGARLTSVRLPVARHGPWSGPSIVPGGGTANCFGTCECVWTGIDGVHNIDGRTEVIDNGLVGYSSATITGGHLTAGKIAGVYGFGPDGASATLSQPTNTDGVSFAQPGTFNFSFSFLTDAPDVFLGQIGGSVTYIISTNFATIQIYIAHGNDGLWLDGGTEDGAYVTAGGGATGDLGPYSVGRLTSGIVSLSVDAFGTCIVTIDGTPHTFTPATMDNSCIAIGMRAVVWYVDDVAAQDATFNWLTQMDGVTFVAASGIALPWCLPCPP